MAVNYLFPSFIASKKCNFDVNSIESKLYEMKENFPESIGHSSKHGWHSPFFGSNDKDLISLLQELNSEIATLVNEIGVSFSGIEVESMWSVINGKGSYNNSHIHGNCNLSGVLYVKCPQNCGNIVFENVMDQRCGLYGKIKNPEYANMYSTYWIEPEENLLLLFHPDQRHHVDVNESDEDRISISFNMRVR